MLKQETKNNDLRRMLYENDNIITYKNVEITTTIIYKYVIKDMTIINNNFILDKRTVSCTGSLYIRLYVCHFSVFTIDIITCHKISCKEINRSY